jgi:hypothetical protein
MYVKPGQGHLIGSRTHVHSPVHLIGGCVPVCLTGKDFHPFGFSAISVLNRQRLAAHNHGYPMKWIDMPGRGRAGLQNQPPD